MKDLDTTIGAGLSEKLCPPCRARLQTKIKRWHLWNIPRLTRTIEANTCEDCKILIWRAGYDHRNTN